MKQAHDASRAELPQGAAPDEMRMTAALHNPCRYVFVASCARELRMFLSPAHREPAFPGGEITCTMMFVPP